MQSICMFFQLGYCVGMKAVPENVTDDKLLIEQDNLRSQCGIAAALDLLGDKWTLLIIRDIMFFGRSKYQEFLNGPEHISTSTLALRLKMLEEKKLINKEVYQENPVRYRYCLTPAGKRLQPVLMALGKWALTEVEGVHGQPLWPNN